MSRQDNSDPLPFVQVDRAVEPSATLLAGHMKVTSQHALGSLIGFWKLCGDPRELERIIEKTPKGKEPAVVLSAEDVALRFQLASDHRVEPVVLARLGILEEVPEGFRVRGMSRFFDTIEARLQARKAASVGGKASAASRKASTGSAQPRSARASTVAQADSEALPKRPRSGPEADVEAPPKPDRSLEVRGQRSEVTPSKAQHVDLEALKSAWNDLTSKPIARWLGGREDLGSKALERRPLAEWAEVFKRINASPFCRGEMGAREGRSVWVATVDWALRPAGKQAEPALKVLEGAYDGKAAAGLNWRDEVDHSQDFFAGVGT